MLNLHDFFLIWLIHPLLEKNLGLKCKNLLPREQNFFYYSRPQLTREAKTFLTRVAFFSSTSISQTMPFFASTSISYCRMVVWKRRWVVVNLEDFSEGLVGKLLIRKSGKVQMMLGQTLLDVEMGTPCGFLQVSSVVRNSVIWHAAIKSSGGSSQNIIAFFL